MRERKKASIENGLPTIIAITVGLLTTLFVVIGGISQGEGATTRYASVSDHDASHTDRGDQAKDVQDAKEPGAATSVAEAPVSTAAPGDEDQAPSQENAAPQAVAQAVAPDEPVTNVTTEDAPPPSIARPANMNAPHLGVGENMRLQTPYVTFDAQFPMGSKADPAYAGLMEKMSIYREEMRERASREHRATIAAGQSFTPWSVDIGYRETARAGDIVSIIGRETLQAGGAHPNLNWDGVIANAETGKALGLADLFLPRKAGAPALAIGLCEGLKKAKVQKIGEASINGEPIDCTAPDVRQRLSQAEFTLVPSTVADKFGGFKAYFAPYDVGAYAEGPYTVIINQEVFAPDLRPNIRELFDGVPSN